VPPPWGAPYRSRRGAITPVPPLTDPLDAAVALSGAAAYGPSTGREGHRLPFDNRSIGPRAARPDRTGSLRWRGGGVLPGRFGFGPARRGRYPSQSSSSFTRGSGSPAGAALTTPASDPSVRDLDHPGAGERRHAVSLADANGRRREVQAASATSPATLCSPRTPKPTRRRSSSNGSGPRRSGSPRSGRRSDATRSSPTSAGAPSLSR
jgi:hypothetical protein